MVLLIGFQTPLDQTLEQDVKQAIDYKANYFQSFLTHNPHSSSKKDLVEIKDPKNIKADLEKHNIGMVVHSNYLLNFCSYPPTSGRIKWALDYYLDELKRLHEIGGIGSVLHIGSSKDLPIKEAYSNFAKNIKYIIKHKPPKVKVILELTAGGGTKIAHNIPEFKKLWKMFTPSEHKQIGICIDTAHIFLTGYCITTIKEVQHFFSEFNKEIGYQHIILMHLNDAKFECGSHKDVHEALGKGYIFDKSKGGTMDALREILRIGVEHHIPLILETHGKYKDEIKLVKKLLQKGGTTPIKVKILDIFRDLLKTHQILDNKFKVKAYIEAIRNLKEYEGPITKGDDLKDVRGIGDSMRRKVDEIIKTGKLKELDDLKKDPKIISRQNLQRVIGIGPSKAVNFIRQDIKSVKELQNAYKKGTVKLTRDQEIGLKYLKNLEKPVQIKEMELYKKYLEKELNKMEKGAKVYLAGSYMTGKAKKEGAHDIDTIVTFPSIKKCSQIKKKLLEDIRDHLGNVVVEVISLGRNLMITLMKLPNQKIVRHVDILISPLESLVTAKIFFGSGVAFSRRLRAIAKSKGYKLNEYALFDLKTGKEIHPKSKDELFKLLDITEGDI